MNLLHPHALWALLLAIPIVAVFLHRGRTRRERIPALAIWREALGAKGRPSGWTRLRELLLLACNLALLGLLVFAAASPGQGGVTEPTAEHWALVIDTSPSMAAVEAGQSRLARARTRALELLDRLPDGAWVSLVAAGAAPVVFGPVPARDDELRDHVRAIDWRPGRGDVAAAWSAVRPHPQAKSFHTVWISDGAGPDGGLLAEFLKDPQHHFLRIGAAAANAGIVGCALERSWGDPEAELDLRVRNGGPDAVERTWTVLLNGKELRQGKVTLPAAPGEARVSVSVPTYTSGMVEIRLDAGDALPLDDAAFLALAPLARPWVCVVHGADEAGFLTPVLAAVQEHLDLSHSVRVSAQDFRPERLPTDGIGVVIFDGCAPAVPLPPGNYLFLGSHGEHVPVASGAPTATPAIGRWAQDHPLLKHAALDHLQIALARRTQPERGLDSLIDSTAGALAVAGTVDGRNLVWLGFRVQDSNLPVLVAFPLLIKNTLGWFAGAGAALLPSWVACGEPVRVAPTAAAQGTAHLRAAGGGAPWEAEVRDRTLVLKQPLPPGAVLVEFDGRRGACGVNLLDAGETDVNATATPERAPALPPRTAPGDDTPTWVRLALWALLLLGVEWVVFHAGREK